ncbi:unnamed protein product, partial [Heterosigma akashiwo]
MRLLSLYFLESDIDQIISETHAEDCEFHDPLVSVYGIENVKAQFRSMTFFFRTSRAVYHNSFANAGSNSVSVESSLFVKPRLWYLGEIEIKMFTICELDRYGRVKKHTDHWSVASLLESIPILSILYKTSRYVCGTMFSKTVN